MEEASGLQGGSHYIDIAGDRYNLSSDQPIELLMKSQRNFANTWGSDNIEILERIFPWPYARSRTVEAISKLPKDNQSKLLSLIQKRISQLKDIMVLNRNSLVSVQIRRTISGLQDLALDINNLMEKKVSEPKKESTKILEELSADEQLNMIFQLAWLLLHPGTISDEEIYTHFEELVRDLQKMRVMDLVKSIRESGEADLQNKEALNSFSRLDLSEPLQINNGLNAALIKAKEAILADHQGKLEKALKDRLKLIMQIFQIYKYIDPDSLIRFQASINGAKKEQEFRNSNSAIEDISGTLLNKINYSFEPFRRFYKQTYDPLWSVISEMPMPMPAEFEELMRLNKLVMELPSKTGVVKVKGSEKCLPFFEKYGRLYREKLEKNEIQIKKLKSTSGTGVDILTKSNFKLIEAHDLEKEDKSKILTNINPAQFIASLNQFFGDNLVYLFCNPSAISLAQTEVIMYEVDISNKGSEITEVDNYFNKQQKKLSQKLKVNDIMTLYMGYVSKQLFAITLISFFLKSLEPVKK